MFFKIWRCVCDFCPLFRDALNLLNVLLRGNGRRVQQLEITRDASIHLLDALMNLDVESIEL